MTSQRLRKVKLFLCFSRRVSTVDQIDSHSFGNENSKDEVSKAEASNSNGFRDTDFESGGIFDLIDLNEPTQKSNSRPVPDFSKLYAAAPPPPVFPARTVPVTPFRPTLPTSSPRWLAGNFTPSVRPLHPQTSSSVYDERNCNLLRMISSQNAPSNLKNPFLNDL